MLRKGGQIRVECMSLWLEDGLPGLAWGCLEMILVLAIVGSWTKTA